MNYGIDLSGPITDEDEQVQVHVPETGNVQNDHSYLQL